MLSSLHLLSTVISKAALNKCKGGIGKMLQEVQKHLQGRKTVEEADDLSWKIWEEASKRWPEYGSNDRGFGQEDATECLLRILSELNEESGDIEKDIETSLDEIRYCTNRSCRKTKHKKISDYIIRTRQIKSNQTINMQHLLDRYLLGVHVLPVEEEEDRCSECHRELAEDTLVDRAPPTMMIQVNRVSTDENRTRSDVKLKIRNRNIFIRRRGQPKQEYELIATLVHHGSLSVNGHYDMNYYDKQEESWYNIDDHKISKLSEHDAEVHNENTVVAVLKRIDAPSNQIIPVENATRTHSVKPQIESETK